MPTVNVACLLPQGVIIGVYSAAGACVGAINLTGARSNPPLATFYPRHHLPAVTVAGNSR